MPGKTLVQLLTDFVTVDDRIPLLDVVKDVAALDRARLLSSGVLMEVVDELWQRCISVQERHLVSSSAYSTWTIFTAFVATYAYKRVCYLHVCTGKVLKTEGRNFKEAVIAVDKTVFCMNELFQANTRLDHEQSLGEVSAAFFNSSNLTRSPTICVEDIIDYCDKFPFSQRFCLSVLMKCFEDAEDSCKLSFARWFPLSGGSNISVCKSYARLLEDVDSWGYR